MQRLYEVIKERVGLSIYCIGWCFCLSSPGVKLKDKILLSTKSFGVHGFVYIIDILKFLFSLQLWIT